MTVDVRKTLTDAGYIAVGVGVLGFQHAQTRRREIQDKLVGIGSPLHIVGDQTNDVRLKVKAGIDRATEAAHGLSTQIIETAKPFIIDVADRSTHLPQPLDKAVEPAVKFAKNLVGASQA